MLKVSEGLFARFDGLFHDWHFPIFGNQNLVDGRDLDRLHNRGNEAKGVVDLSVADLPFDDRCGKNDNRVPAADLPITNDTTFGD